MGRIGRFMARRFLPFCALCAVVVFVSLVAPGCAPRGGNVADDATGTSSAPTVEVSSSTTTPDPEGSDLVILLAVASSMVSTYQRIWPDYQMPLFALWPDGRVLVLERGGFGATPVYLEAQLDRQQLDTLRGWVQEAKVSTLADTYPQPQRGASSIMISDTPEVRLRIRDGDTRAEVIFALGYPINDVLFPARLDTLDKRLRSYRPPNAHTFVHDRIEVVVTERARTGVENTYYPLPAEFSLDGMTEIFRSVDDVLYSKTFGGAEAARIAMRIDAGEWLYQDARRSYWITYRPLLEWPKP